MKLSIQWGYKFWSSPVFKWSILAGTMQLKSEPIETKLNKQGYSIFPSGSMAFNYQSRNGNKKENGGWTIRFPDWLATPIEPFGRFVRFSNGRAIQMPDTKLSRI